MLKNNRAQDCHPFQILFIKPGIVVVYEGFVIHTDLTVSKISVDGTSTPKDEYVPFYLNDGDTLYVLINHSSISDSEYAVAVNSCELTTSSSIDSDTQTLVKVGIVEWTDSRPRIEQILHSDIHCAILGTKP